MKLIQSMGIFLLLTIFLVFTGCGDDEVTLESITVSNADTDDIVSEGSTEQFTATGNYSDGTTKDLTSSVDWSASDNTVATINSSGLATIAADVTSGTTVTITATITIDAIPHTDSETLTVTSSAPTSGSVSIVAGATSLCTGAYDQDTITVALDATTSTATVTWTNNDTVPHTVISTDDTGTSCTASGGTTTGSPINSGTTAIAANETYQATFTATGEYNYVCTQPGHLMRGKVKVE